MRRFRPSAMALLATLFIVTGFGLMVASLRVEADRAPSAASAESYPVIVPTTAAARPSTNVVPAPSEERATALFTRSQNAARTVAYAGVKKVTRFVDGTPTVTTVTVEHVPGHGTLVAQGEVAQVDTRAATLTAESVAADESMAMQVLVNNYQLRAADTERYLDRDTRIVEAYRPDTTVAARFWIDEDSALVLRRDLIDQDGSTTERTEYVKLAVGRTTVTPTAAPSAAGWSPVEDVAALRADGWTVPPTLDDGLVLFQVRQQGTGDARIVQLGYTDGLLAVSVFLQRGVLHRDAMTGFVPMEVANGEVWARTGALFYTWQRRAAVADPGGATDVVAPEAVPVPSPTAAPVADDLVVSVLADNPRAPVGAVLAAFPPAAAAEVGVGEHVTRGAKRVGRWIDPLG